jgi:hypothetical protein
VIVDTAGQIVNDAAIELGLIQTEITDPFGSTDPNISMLCRLITRAGRSLLNSYGWQTLSDSGTFNTVNGQSFYEFAVDPFPSAFGRFVDNSLWDTTNKLQLVGPLTWPQVVELQTFSPNAVSRTYFVSTQQGISLTPTPTSVRVIQYGYRKKWWVGGTPMSDAKRPTTDRVTSSSQVPWFPSELMSASVKLLFLQANGMDTSAARDLYDEMLSQAQSADAAAPVLDLVPIDAGILDPAIPITGFGK